MLCLTWVGRVKAGLADGFVAEVIGVLSANAVCPKIWRIAMTRRQTRNASIASRKTGIAIRMRKRSTKIPEMPPTGRRPGQSYDGVVSEPTARCRQCHHRLTREQPRCPECSRLVLAAYKSGRDRLTLPRVIDFHGPRIPGWLLVLVAFVFMVLIMEFAFQAHAGIDPRDATLH